MLLLMAPPVAAETRAILIGVGRFDYLNITPLESRVNDVVLMAATLRMRGIPEKNIVQLTDYAAIDDGRLRQGGSFFQVLALVPILRQVHRLSRHRVVQRHAQAARDHEATCANTNVQTQNS